jgi:hypothetical protein
MKKILVVAVVLFAGCDNQHLVGRIGQGGNDAGLGATADGPVGSRPDGNGGAQTSPVSTADGPDPSPGNAAFTQGGPVGSPDARVIGPITQAQTSWTGYIENFQFPSGSDVVKVTFASDSAGQVVGGVVLGNGTPPAPATDPNVGYPADFPTMFFGPALTSYWAEGFSYSMVTGISSSQRLRFSVNNFELWSGWCALQTPVDGSGTCVPTNEESTMSTSQCSQQNPVTGQTTIVDCGKLYLCLFACRCSTTSCTAADSAPALSFDIAITNNDASGSVNGNLGDNLVDHNVHFTQDQ